jgi:hypothetical protein
LQNGRYDKILRHLLGLLAAAILSAVGWFGNRITTQIDLISEKFSRFAEHFYGYEATTEHRLTELEEHEHLQDHRLDQHDKDKEEAPKRK